MLSLAGILLALGLLIALSYRGVSVIVLSPAMAFVAALFAVGTPLLATYTQVFMPAAGDFFIRFFPLFLLGAIFGRLMEDSGAAGVIARTIVSRFGAGRAALAVVLSCAALTYGGVSLFVVAFAVFPVAAALFRVAEIPKRLIPAAIALGAFTFTMTALPGTPAIQNAIPTPYFGTTPFAAPGLGIVAALVMFGFGQFWLGLRIANARARKQGYTDGLEGDVAEEAAAPHKEGPSLPLSAAPVLVVLIANYAFSAHLLPALDTGYLAQERYGATTLPSVLGLWSVTLALCAAILVLVATSWRRLAEPDRSLSEGAAASVIPIVNTASLVGFGAVVASLPAFALVREWIDGVGGGVLVSLAVSSSVLAGLTGSASGGMVIALDALGAEYLALALESGIDPAVLHRVVALATGGLDTLPHNGAVVTLLALSGISHARGYGDIFMVAVVGPVLATLVVIVLAGMFGGF
ncbi:MAG: GntP family permease [Salinarimonadaceae bacterium]|nr:MAG: GntP family permease [Salinarimonadaceae bacterium]